MLLILIFLSAIAATVAYVIGYCGRTSPRVTSSKREVMVTKETACQAGRDETDSKGLLNVEFSCLLTS